MQLKTIEKDGVAYAVVQDGKPVYVGADGSEVAFDAPGTVNTISRLTDESKGYKSRAQAAEGKLASFEGIDDPDAARKALATVANLDDKKLVDAGEVQRVKDAAIAAVEAKYKPVVDERDALKGELYSEKIGGAFKGSAFIAEKVAVPADMVQATFGKAFKVEDGKVVAYGENGQPIPSSSRPGENADFEEALAILVDGYAHKNSILKAANPEGMAPLGKPGPAGNDIFKLPPLERMEAGRAQQNR